MKTLPNAYRRHGLPFGKPYQFLIKCGTVILLFSAILILTGMNAKAAMIPGNLTIEGSVDFDDFFASAVGTVSQAGSFSTTEGGMSTSGSYSGTSVTSSADPLLGTLTETGDGFGIIANSSSDTVDSAFGIGFDILIGITNSSTQPYLVKFKVDFDNQVNSAGVDAFASSEYTVDDAGGEVFFTDLYSDTLDTGGLLEDSGEAFFHVIVGPGLNSNIEGFYTLEGGVFADPGAAAVDFDAFISVYEVTEVPVPATLILFGTGLTGLAAIRRWRRRV